MSGLTQSQLAELKRSGLAVVRAKLANSRTGTDRGASVDGFESGMMTRGEIEDWLGEQDRLDLKRQKARLRWAAIAGWVGLIAIVVTALATIVFQK